MKMIALRIPDGLKTEMDRLKINWSDFIRDSIQDAIGSRKKRSLLKKLDRIRRKQAGPEPGTAASILRRIRGHG